MRPLFPVQNGLRNINKKESKVRKHSIIVVLERSNGQYATPRKEREGNTLLAFEPEHQDLKFSHGNIQTRDAFLCCRPATVKFDLVSTAAIYKEFNSRKNCSCCYLD